MMSVAIQQRFIENMGIIQKWLIERRRSVALRTFVTGALFLLMLSLVATLRAGLMYAWSYQEMFDRANLVVIAKPLWSKDTDERSKLPGVGENVPLIGVNTGFEVRVVLKGDKQLKDFTLHYYRLADPEVAIINGPVLVEFDTKKPRAYLMFLIKEPDGKYAPATDQTDPGAFSIIKLESSAE
jgi:hypothetical protein